LIDLLGTDRPAQPRTPLGLEQTLPPNPDRHVGAEIPGRLEFHTSGVLANPACVPGNAWSLRYFGYALPRTTHSYP